MKKLCLFGFVLFFSNNLFSQFGYPESRTGYFTGGAGMSWIDGEPHYSLSLRPEISFSDLGFGLDLNFEIDKNGNLRKENFNELSDYLGIIRYVRYGFKGDPFYLRLGALDRSTLGHGSIVQLYNNSPTYDARRIGLEMDIDFSTFGFETIYGSFAQAGVIGLRGYLRPLLMTDAKEIPVLNNLEVGLSVVSDFNEYAGVIDGEYQSSGNFAVTEDRGNLTAAGFDVGLPLIKSDMLRLLLYYDFVKILDFGSGSAVGAVLDYSGLGIIDLRARLERRINGKKYLPSYFNSFYEIERFRLDKNSGTFTSKAAQLDSYSVSSAGNGYYGELYLVLLKAIEVLGSYQRLDKEPESGILHLMTDISPRQAPFIARAGYDKVRIKGESDIFKLDDRSFLFAEIGYKPLEFLVVSLVYQWTFRPVRDAGEEIIDYEPQKRLEPRVYVQFPFDAGTN